MPEAAAVNRSLRMILMGDGTLARISMMLDCDGDETDDPDDACVAICPTIDGRWLVVDLREFESAEIH